MAETTHHEERPSRRSLWTAAALAAGYLAAFVLRRDGAIGPAGVLTSVAWFGCAAGALVLAVVVRGRFAPATLGAALVLMGAGWFTARVLERPRTSAAWVLEPEVARSGEPALVELEGCIRGMVRAGRLGEGALAWAMPKPAGVAFDLDVAALVGDGGHRTPCSGAVRVWVEHDEDSTPPWMAGERVRVLGLYRPISGPRNPGERDARLWEAQRGVVGRLSASGPDLVRTLPPGSPVERAESWVLRIGSAARARALNVLESRAVADEAGGEPVERAQARALLKALLLGERTEELAPVSRAFTNLGLLHVVSISGFHLVMLTWVALLGLRLVRDMGWLEPALIAVLVIAYLLVLPAEGPILRSGAMVLILLATEAAGRRYDRVSVLGWIACAVLLWRPMELWSAGFQLSFALTGVLLGAASACERRLFGEEIRGVLRPRGLRHRAGRWAWRHARAALTVNLLCWAVATPIIACHTGVLTPLGVLTSLVVMPLVMFVLALGYAVLLTGVLVPAAGGLLDGPLIDATQPMLRLVLVLDQAPGMSVRLPALSAGWACAGAGLILWCFTAAPFSPRRDRRAWLSVSSIAAMVAWTALELSRPARVVPGGVIRIDTLAVGDGTCHLVRTRRRALLWDCGSVGPDVGVRLIPRAVRALGAWTVPTVVVTHANFDHYSGLLDAAGPLGVRHVLVSRAMLDEARAAPSGAVGSLLEGLRARGVSVEAVAAGDRLDLGDGVVHEILWPPDGRHFARVNDRSLVGAVRWADDQEPAAVLFTGDIGAEAIAELLSENLSTRLRASVLEAPHHGSYSPLSERFVGAVSPEVVVQSTGGRGGRDDDPRWEAQRAKRRWWVTHRDGAISTRIVRAAEQSVRAMGDEVTSETWSADRR